VEGVGELGADQILEGPPWDPQHVTQVNDGEAGATVGFSPLPSHCIGLRTTDAQQAARFLHREQRRDLPLHAHNPYTMQTTFSDSIMART
jgi:hypothetical protein